MTTEPNPYTRLGLMPGCSPAEIKRRYRQLAKQHHPDLNGNAAASEEKLRALNAAYSLLSDPVRKAAYDNRPGTLFSPVYSLRPMPAVRRQRRNPYRAGTGLALVLLISAVAATFIASGHDPALPAWNRLLPQFSGTAVAGADLSGPDFSFIPSRSVFDGPSNAAAWSRGSRHHVKN